MEEVGLRTRFDFELPMGFVDEAGTLHRRGEMRLATARDEIEPLRDPQVARNEAYLTVLVLARVITRLGDITEVTPAVVENLFAADLAYLQDFYGIANFGDQSLLVVEDEVEADVGLDLGLDEATAEPADESASVVEGDPIRASTVEEIPVAEEAVEVRQEPVEV